MDVCQNQTASIPFYVQETVQISNQFDMRKRMQNVRLQK